MHMPAAPLFILLVLSALFGVARSRCPADPAPLTLTNSLLSASFDALGLCSVTFASLDFSFVLPIDSDGFSFCFSVDGVYSNDVVSAALSAPKIIDQSSDGRILFVFVSPLNCSDESAVLTSVVEYSLQPSWHFISKRISLVISSSSASPPFNSLYLQQVGVIDPFVFQTVPNAWMMPQGNFGTWGLFLRFNTSEEVVDANRLSMLATVHNPFLSIRRSAQDTDISVSYSPFLNISYDYFSSLPGGFSFDSACIGFTSAASEEIPFPSQSSSSPSSIFTTLAASSAAASQLDSNERTLFAHIVRDYYNLLQAFPNGRTKKLHVGWTANDYQIDIAATSANSYEYLQIFSRAAEIGIGRILFAPQNSDVSSRYDATDDWGWEEALWLTLGEGIRNGSFDVNRDALPPTVTAMIDAAEKSGVKLMAYIYPSMAYAVAPSMLHPVTRRQAYAASIDSIDFQSYFISLLDAFISATGIDGVGFDYTFFDDSSASLYAQWWGWRRILAHLRSNYVLDSQRDFHIDNRQLNHQWGPWMWAAGGYAEPLTSDEQPESWSTYLNWDLHTDRLSANYLRYINYQYAQTAFAPIETIAGFISHQTDRSDSTLHWSDFNVRDFDFVGFRFSVLSSIATAPFNNVFCLLPARDNDEFTAWPNEEKSFVRKWLDFVESHTEVIKNLKWFPSVPAVDSVDGTWAVDSGVGFIFLFNPSSQSIIPSFQLPINAAHGFNDVCELYLLRQLYPTEENLQYYAFGSTISHDALSTPARSARVLSVSCYNRVASAKEEFILFGGSADAKISYCPFRRQLTVENVAATVGAQRELRIYQTTAQSEGLPGKKVEKVVVNGRAIPFLLHQEKLSEAVYTVLVRFRGSSRLSYFSTAGIAAYYQLGVYNASFAGGLYSIPPFTLPVEILQQLAQRRREYPVGWTADDNTVPWLNPGRLLLYIDTSMTLTPAAAVSIAFQLHNLDRGTVYNKTVQVAFNARSTKVDYTFQGFFVDVTEEMQSADKETFSIQLTMPGMTAGKFRGVFVENLRAEELVTSELEGVNQ